MKKILFFAVLLSFFTINQAFADCSTSDQVKEADKEWASAINSNKAREVANLYAEHAIMIPAYAKKSILSESGRKEYFAALFKNSPHLQVYFNRENIYTFPGGAVSSGTYTFYSTKNGKNMNFPAHYTFVYQATQDGCILVADHSSQKI
jgi:hypothetical protein